MMPVETRVRSDRRLVLRYCMCSFLIDESVDSDEYETDTDEENDKMDVIAEGEEEEEEEEVEVEDEEEVVVAAVQAERPPPAEPKPKRNKPTKSGKREKKPKKVKKKVGGGKGGMTVVQLKEELKRRGLSRTGKKAELEARGYVVDCEQPVVLKYTVSTGVELSVQTNYIDFIVRDLSAESTVGIELKHARVVSAAHIRQAEGYSKALEMPVAAVAMSETGADVKVVTTF